MTREEVEILANQGRYRGTPIQGEIVETHISWVVLTADFAFKIKKPVKMSFLDFSRRDDRKFYCNREIILNRRTTDIYIEVMAIVRDGNGFSMQKENGDVVDYAVVMNRIDTSFKMDVMLENSQMTEKDVQKLAESIGHFHLEADRMSFYFDLNQNKNRFNALQEVAALMPEQYHATNHEIAEIIQWSNTWLERNAPFFQERIHQGWVRDVHGDLHAGNIFLCEKPVLFDCIEFNDHFRQIDLLNEIAFLCMDLEAHGREDLASVFLDRYEQIVPCVQNDHDRLIFTYYKCYRANVRAKVSALAYQQQNHTRDKDPLGKQFLLYHQLMKHYKMDIAAQEKEL